MIGTYNRTWKEWRRRKNGKPVIFSDSVPMKNVLHHPIELTKSKELPPKTVNKLKELYHYT